MELLLILTYTALTIGVFRVFNIPLNKWTVPTAALGGVVMVGALVTVMNFNHPYTEICRSYFVTTPIVSRVKGIVTEVAVKPNSHVKKGAVLFKIDPEPFKQAVASLQARLEFAEKDYQRKYTLFRSHAGSASQVDSSLALRDALKAQLSKAIFDLEGTIVYAPTDGFVTQLTLRPGTMTVPLPLKPVLIFVHDEEYSYVGWFHQNNLLRLKKGDSAEIALDAIPGKVFKANVGGILPVLGEGQVQTGGTLIKVALNAHPGRVPVFLDVDDEQFKQYSRQLPGGVYGQAAIYTKYAHHLAVMRKILLRMSSWLSYVFPFH